MSQRKKTSTSFERLLMVSVSLLGLAFLIAATLAFVRSLLSEPTPVADTISARQTQQASGAAPETQATEDPALVSVATVTAVPDNIIVQVTTASDAAVQVTVVSIIGEPPTAVPSIAPAATLSPVVDTPLPSAVVVATGATAAPVPSATTTLAPSATATIAPPTATATIVPASNIGAAPGPSPTWSLFNLPAPLPASGPTKLSFHVQLNSGGVLEYVAAVQPPVIKSVGDLGFLREVKALSPNTVTIGRYIVDEWQHTISQGNPEEEARRFVASQLSRYEEHREYVDYWEGYNEVHWTQMEWYARFEAERVCEMQRLGYLAAIGSFSTGTPEPWQFMDFLPAVEAAKRCGGIMTMHEYGAPTYYLWWEQGIPSVPGQPHYPNRGPLAGRYRWIYEDILRPRDLIIPLVITEAGIDGLVANGQRPGSNIGRGWLDFRDYWVQQGLTTDPNQFYVDQLIWYDSILRQDDYVIGATIFTIGGGCCDHSSYEAADIIPLLTEYALSLR